MRMLMSLKKWQLHMLKNNVWHGGRDRRKLIMQVVGIAGFAALIFSGSLALFRSLSDLTVGAPPGVLATLQMGLLSSVALGMLIFLFMTGLRSINDVLFQADDLAFLLAQPIPSRAIFAAKFLDAYNVSLAYVGPVALSVWIAFGVANEAPALFYPLVVMTGLCGVLLYHSVVVMLLLVIMRFVPGQLMKQLLLVLAGLGAITIVLASQVFASRAVQESLQDPLALFETVGRWGLDSISFLPHVWITKAILLPLPSFDYSWVESVLPLAIAAFGMSALSISLAGHLYAQGWASGLEVATRRVRSRGARSGSLHNRWPQGPFWAILRKDLLLLKREPLVWYFLLSSSIVISFFYYNIRGESGSDVGMMVILMPVLMATVSSTQLGGVGISREGASWPLLRSHLGAPKSLYWSKLLFALMPPLLFVTVTVFVLEHFTNLAPYSFGTTLGISWLMTAGVAAFQILLDILTPDFTLKIEFGGSRKNSSGTGKVLVATVGVLMYLGAMGLLLFLGTMYRESAWLAGKPDETVTLLSFGLVGLWAVVTWIISYMWGTRRLQRLLTAE